MFELLYVSKLSINRWHPVWSAAVPFRGSAA
jgi:hypothetical protein